MRTILGVTCAAALVLAAGVTQAAGQAARGQSAVPYPLVIIDGVKRPDLPPRLRYAGAVVAETTTTPSFKITYKGPTVLDSSANRLYPSPENLALMQIIDAPASGAHFGAEAKYGAVLYYTKQYRKAGGAILFPLEGNQVTSMMDPATPADVRAQVIVDRMFAGITISAAQRASALAISGKYVAAQSALPHGPILAIWPRILQITDERDVALRALLTNAQDLAKFDVREVEGRPKGIVTPDAVADNMYINLFVYDTLTLTKPAEVRAHDILRQALIGERVLFDKSPDDYDGRVAIRRKRDADLRALLTSDRDRAKFDARVARTMQMEVRRP